MTASAIDSKVVVVIYNIADSAWGEGERPANAVGDSKNHSSSTIPKNREDDFHSPILYKLVTLPCPQSEIRNIFYFYCCVTAQFWNTML